jgi:rSAM/selenodomain-associated transferase 1
MADQVGTVLIIFAKEPASGQVKTRLCPPLSPQAAARLYGQFLEDVLEEMARLPQISIALAYTPASARPFFHNLAAPGMHVTAQAGEDLGERLQQAFDWGFAQGAGTVLIRNSDSPDLPGSLVTEAQQVLGRSRAQVVLGPCPDGGYYLVGLNRPQPQLFQGIAWSGPTVLADTLARAESLGLMVQLLPPWPDIDTFEDLLAFVSSPKTSPTPGWRSFDLAKALLAGNVFHVGEGPGISGP